MPFFSKVAEFFRDPDKSIMGVPARFMRPRLVLILVTTALVALGIVMVFSASSIKGLLSDAEDPSTFLVKQVIATFIGLVLAIIIASKDYHFWAGRAMPFIWWGTLALLGAVFVFGMSAKGATRWIPVGPLTIQPSEFAKLTLVTLAAVILQAWDQRKLVGSKFLRAVIIGLAVPLLLILIQPDKGTTMVIGATVLIMAYMAGYDRRQLLVIAAVAVVGFFAYSLKDSYSRARFLTMLNPFADASGDGYQLVQGFYAFGSGGLFGLGLGNSRQKYSYLPEAHNDFIFAVIGEELGLVGCVLVIAGFLAILWCGFRIAREAPDLTGTLIAAGCSLLLVCQFFLNVAGVTGVFPLSGKAVPFISYGASSMMASLAIVGMIVSVSRSSSLPETRYDKRRASMRTVSAEPAAPAAPAFSLVDKDTGVSEAVPRSESAKSPRSTGSVSLSTRRSAAADEARARRAASSENNGSPAAIREARKRGDAPRGRTSTDKNGRTRIDLGPDARDRLRGSRSDRDTKGR